MTSAGDKPVKKSPKVTGYVLNEKGEEVPITEEMVEQSMTEVKLQSMGVHTGYNKIITDEMLAGLGADADDKK